MRKGSRKDCQEEPSEERQEGSSNEKAGRRRGAKALERAPGHLAGQRGGGVPRVGATRRDPGEGVGTKQHKDQKELVEGPTKELQENWPRSKKPESHRKDLKKEGRQGQPQKKQTRKRSLSHQDTQNVGEAAE